jgi:hypothetical protein
MVGGRKRVVVGPKAWRRLFVKDGRLGGETSGMGENEC